MYGQRETRREHNFIPKLLLKGFTMSGRPADVLWQFDRTRPNPVKKQAGSGGWESDFYSVGSPIFASDIYERVFAALEDPSARLLDGIRKTEELPSDEPLVSLMCFVALTYHPKPTRKGRAVRLLWPCR
jgi:hypothetical protein